jgi:hypothetical protein
MKFKTHLFSLIARLAVIAVAIPIHLQAQTVLSDNFDGGTIDPTLWQTSEPFSDSSITEGGGYAIFENRGRIITVTNLPTAIDITGSFAFTGNIHDDFTILTRTDGITSNPSAEYDHGMKFALQIENDLGQTTNNVTIIRNSYPATSPVLATGTYPLSLNTFYNFRITDDGTKLAFYINDLTNPVVTASDSTTYSNLLAVYNREGAGGGSTISAGSISELEFITVQEIPNLASVSPALCLNTTNLVVGGNYQIQTSGDLTNWTNYGAPFIATATNEPQYVNVTASQGFYRIEPAP